MFWTIISALGGTAALIAVAAFLSKLLVQHWLEKDIDRYKNELSKELEAEKARLTLANSRALDEAKFQFEKELIVRRGEMDLVRDRIKYLNETEQQRRSRLEAEIKKWANPIRVAIADLEHRLSNILDGEGYVALSPASLLPDRWSADYSYFMASTLYYFAQYFCWTRFLQNELAYELFESGDAMQEFLDSMERVTDEISRFPYDSANSVDPTRVDRQVFRLQQRALGELIVDRSGTGPQVLTYREFLDRWLDPNDVKLKTHVAPLEAFLTALQPQNDLRWQRLDAARGQLKEFHHVCNRVLNWTETDAF